MNHTIKCSIFSNSHCLVRCKQVFQIIHTCYSYSLLVYYSNIKIKYSLYANILVIITALLRNMHYLLSDIYLLHYKSEFNDLSLNTYIRVLNFIYSSFLFITNNLFCGSIPPVFLSHTFFYALSLIDIG